MTDLREAAQQALEAIRIFREWEMGADYESNRDTVLARALEAEEALEAALAEPDEPVAWRYKYSDGFWRFSNGRRINGCDPIDSQPLYTRPAPQRQPLRTITYVCPICAASLERQE